ncbi:FKBP-type peptidyl-prolyl cis-trans isomerase [Rhodanobacter sp. 7MK24]|uniref:FKBP-type peptidyl-prolyl cis-trans isomerase n=1 Tax=Rhodanobacter sp. 7MK24 TaxID=2775922 RepID=UPI0017813BA8|nr:FKBP-type peptidyl-prolyl cis-trans isomerase [Rhodanobacter sp. 7MK24]MBD8879433.1 FKBP-type peptidyl-prolyl cis-trans isomerase [Rhodanobacter sp. 7MK24]
MRHRLTLLAAVSTVALAACNRIPPSPEPAGHGQVDKLTEVDTKVGTGPEAKPGMTVQVLYTGWLYDDRAKDKHGSKFDSTDDHGDQAFSFPLGQGQVIKGWDQGVTGMHVGGERTLLIPAELGYGARGASDVIPPNTSLVFDVKLVGVTQ